jgi:UDP-2-acetamido-3-amino-2,3-dideoxy-glucuronate N-acetyltransferase
MGTPFFVHESSYVDDGVVIGEGTMIWHFCHILSGVRLGRDCRVGQNVMIGPDVCVGNNVKIQNNVSVYRGVTLEDDVFCGPSMVFTNVNTPRSAFPRNQPEDFLPTLVRRGASIGANATVVCGCEIGEYALIGAGAVVTHSVPRFGLVYGNPARLAGWVCRCGVPLRFLDEGGTASQNPTAACVECGRWYRSLSGGGPDAGIEELESSAPQGMQL